MPKTPAQRKADEREKKNKRGLVYFVVGLWIPKEHENVMKQARPRIKDYIRKLVRRGDDE